jgi:hypothetical protein
MRFDAIAFIKDSTSWNGKIKEYEKELESVSELKGIEPTGGHTGAIGDPVANVASVRGSIIANIKRYKGYQEAYKAAYNSLPVDYQEVIDLFFFKKGNKGVLVHDYGMKYGLGVKLVYTARRLALEAFADYINDNYL